MKAFSQPTDKARMNTLLPGYRSLLVNVGGLVTTEQVPFPRTHSLIPNPQQPGKNAKLLAEIRHDRLENSNYLIFLQQDTPAGGFRNDWASARRSGNNYQATVSSESMRLTTVVVTGWHMKAVDRMLALSNLVYRGYCQSPAIGGTIPLPVRFNDET